MMAGCMPKPWRTLRKGDIHETVVSGEHCTRATGGTAMAIRIASAENVPALNLCRPETQEMLEDWVRADCASPEPWL